MRRANQTLGPPCDASEIWSRRALILAVMCACAVAFSKSHADPDIWGHFQYGSDAIQNGLPSTATYTYTAPGHRWINHEIVSEYLLAVALPVLGQAGLLALKCLLGLGMLVLMFRAGLRRGVELIPVLLALLLVAASLMQFWCLRPQLMTYLFFALMIAVLDAVFFSPWELAGRRVVCRRVVWLWTLVPLFAVWANTHGGFVAGYCVLVTYLTGRSIQLLRHDGRRATRTVLLFGSILLVAGLATLLNPYGMELDRWLLNSLRSPRPEIVEWRAPELWHPAWVAWWTLVAVFFVCVVGSRRARDPVQMLLLGLTLWQACVHRRHIPFFVILFGYWMPLHLQSVMARLQRQTPAPAAPPVSSGWRRWGRVVALVASSVMILVYLIGQLKEIRVPKNGYPVAAFQYMADQQLDGRLVIQFKWAQYAIAAFASGRPGMPHMEVAFDGRFRTCYPQEVVDLYFDFAKGAAAPGTRCRSPNSPPVRVDRILELGRPNLVLIDRQRRHPVAVMQAHRSEWILLYQDQLAQLWGRRSIYDDSSRRRYIESSARRITNRPQLGLAKWPALPRHRQVRDSRETIHTSSVSLATSRTTTRLP